MALHCRVPGIAGMARGRITVPPTLPGPAFMPDARHVSTRSCSAAHVAGIARILVNFGQAVSPRSRDTGPENVHEVE